MRADQTPDRVTALRDQRAELLQFCSDITDYEWHQPSAAPGWRVKDVVAHLGSGCHSLFTPAAVALLRSSDIERSNDEMVDARRDWTPQDVLDEYTRWSSRVDRLAGVVAATPLNGLRVPLAELGRFPLGLLLGGAMVFDVHTHLRYDIAPALGRAAPPTDDNRMSVVVEWMLAVLSNQLRGHHAAWLDRTVSLSLTGRGGGTWSISRDGVIASGDARGPVGASIVAVAEEFPGWGTRRSPWRECSVTVTGDVDYGERFLDEMNVV